MLNLSFYVESLVRDEYCESLFNHSMYEFLGGVPCVSVFES